MAKSATPAMNSYEFDYSLDQRGQAVTILQQMGFEDELIAVHLDIVDGDIRRCGFGGAVLLNLCVHPPVMVTVKGRKGK